MMPQYIDELIDLDPVAPTPMRTHIGEDIQNDQKGISGVDARLEVKVYDATQGQSPILETVPAIPHDTPRMNLYF